MQTEWNAQDLEDVGNKLHIVTGQHFSDDEVQNVLDNGSSDQLYKQALQDNISGVHVRYSSPLTLLSFISNACIALLSCY